MQQSQENSSYVKVSTIEACQNKLRKGKHDRGLPEQAT